jgi:hypothetical protein
MKPSKAKAIVLFNKLRWRGSPVDLALPVGRRIPPRTLNWLKTFAQSHGRPLVYSEQVLGPDGYTGQQEVFGFGPPEFQAWVRDCERRGEKLW